MRIMKKQKYGELQFTSSIQELNDGFVWAKQTALSYAHHGGDPVGLWYEAALPARNAFCMRDTAHHAQGAAALGLAAHTRNMLYHFAASISEEKDWCGYWEITGDNLPCPSDYRNDKDFWYNLPGSFEIIIACWQDYLRTGDRTYLTDPVFNRYYETTCTKFAERWDKDGDGLLEHYPEYGRRGIASYNERDIAILHGGDMLASQWAAFGAYANILKRQGKEEKAALFLKKQAALKKAYLSRWYDAENNRFYGAVLMDGSFYPEYYKEGNFLPVYFGLLNGEKTLKAAYRQLLDNPPDNVEGRTYMPQIFYLCGDEETGLSYLKSLGSPDLYRREYPEVSFALIGSIAGCVMGIKAEEGTVITKSGIPQGEHAKLEKLPVFMGTIDVSHEGKNQTVLTNKTDEKILWKAVFDGNCRTLYLDGQSVPFEVAADASGRTVSILTVELSHNETKSVRAESSPGRGAARDAK